MLQNTLNRQKYQSVEENIAEQMGTSGPERCTARCTLKLPCTSSKDSAAYCVKALKSFFKKARKLGDKKVFIAPQCNIKEEVLENAALESQMPTDLSELSSHIPRFFVRREEGRRTEYLKINLGSAKRIKYMKDEMRRQIIEKGCNLFPKEASFLVARVLLQTQNP